MRIESHKFAGRVEIIGKHLLRLNEGEHLTLEKFDDGGGRLRWAFHLFNKADPFNSIRDFPRNGHLLTSDFDSYLRGFEEALEAIKDGKIQGVI